MTVSLKIAVGISGNIRLVNVEVGQEISADTLLVKLEDDLLITGLSDERCVEITTHLFVSYITKAHCFFTNLTQPLVFFSWSIRFLGRNIDESKICRTCYMFMFRIYGSRCGKKETAVVAIDEKHDKCDICQIGVTDNQFATEIILENGKALKFDDIGCMYKWMEINSDEKTKEKFVRDYDSKD